MKIKTYILFTVLLVGSPALADTTASREYQVKAAFLYNFIQFVDWPKEKMGDGNEPIIIGVIGKDPFGDAFDPIVDKEIHGKKLLVKRFMAFEELKKTGEKDKSLLDREIESLRKCHLLFICSSEDKCISEILNSVKEHSVLTIGEVQGFLEAGGIVNFVMEEKKVRFEISMTAAKSAKLKIRSQLLKLAKRVVGEDSDKGNKNG